MHAYNACAYLAHAYTGCLAPCWDSTVSPCWDLKPCWLDTAAWGAQAVVVVVWQQRRLRSVPALARTCRSI